MTEELIRKVDVGWLLSIYGTLLTEKQHTIAMMYYEEDYSLSEIAQQESITRQSVYETLQRVEKQLRSWEEKLRIRRRLHTVETCLEQALSELSADSNASQHIQQAMRLLNDEEETNGL